MSRRHAWIALALLLGATGCTRDHARDALVGLAERDWVAAEIAAERAATRGAKERRFRDGVFAFGAFQRAGEHENAARTGAGRGAWMAAITELRLAADLWQGLALDGDEVARRNAERAARRLSVCLDELENAPASSSSNRRIDAPGATPEQDLVDRLLEQLERMRKERPRQEAAPAGEGEKDW